MAKAKATKFDKLPIYEFWVAIDDETIDVEASYYSDQDGILNFYTDQPLKLIGTFRKWDYVIRNKLISSSQEP